MIIKVKRKRLESVIAGLIGLLTVASIMIGVSFTADYVAGATNITNNTVLARVNVTNTDPNITNVFVDDDLRTPIDEIDLTAHGARVVTCNVSVFDYNGWEDIDPNATNATFYMQSVGRDGDTDNNHRYRNESCGKCTQVSSTNASCECRFGVEYYANNSNQWRCNVTIRDKGGTGLGSGRANFSDTEVSGLVTITKLLAINTSSLIDYGNLSVSQTSSEVTFNVTNAGNINLNLSLRGYGGDDEDLVNARNYSMICAFGNITFESASQRYEVGDHKSGIAFNEMRNLTNQTTPANFTFPIRTDDTNYGSDRNSTLWRLNVPFGVGGICNGTIVFAAVDASV